MTPTLEGPTPVGFSMSLAMSVGEWVAHTRACAIAAPDL